MVEGKRDRVLNVRLLEAEVEMLGELAETEGVSQSEWIRNVIRAQHAVLQASKPKPKPRRK
jgi:hypothetical protein